MGLYHVSEFMSIAFFRLLPNDLYDLRSAILLGLTYFMARLLKSDYCIGFQGLRATKEIRHKQLASNEHIYSSEQCL